MNYVNPSSNRYALAAKEATNQGYRPGGRDWWECIRGELKKMYEAETTK